MNMGYFEMTRIVDWCESVEWLEVFATAAMTAVAAAAAVSLARKFARGWRNARKAGRSVAPLALFAAYAAMIEYVGGTKPPQTPSATIAFDAGLYDAGSVLTNDWPEIRWTYDPWTADAALHVSARPKDSTNATDWADLHVGKVGDAFWSGHVPGCTGMAFWVWSDYVPAAEEVRNGVLHVNYVARPMGRESETNAAAKWMLLRTKVLDADGGRVVSPPEIPAPLGQ